MFVILKMKWEMTLKYKLTCDDFSVEIINEGQNNVSVILKSYFNNMSSLLPIQYAVKDISFLLQSKGNDQAPDHFDAHSLSPGAFSPVTWPAIHNIDIRAPIKGTLKFNVDYGVPGQKQKRRLIQKIGVDLAISRKRDKYEILQMIAVETQTYH